MPRTNIDYSKTIIYKICCYDRDITECYIGQTSNFKNRKNAHKKVCNNVKSKRHNDYLYKFIRDNGGWDNWDMVPIEEYPCSNSVQSRIREQHWKDTLNAELNINRCYAGVDISSHDAKAYIKKYIEVNKQELEEKSKEYREKNKVIISEKRKISRTNNIEHMRLKDKENYERYKEKIKERGKLIINCICGSVFKNSNFQNHKKSKKHINYLNLLNIEK
jgi:hypothetical protein